MGMGLQAGAQTTDIIVALSTDVAVDELISSGRMRFGGDAHFTLPEVIPGPEHGGSSYRGVGGNRGVTAYSRAHGMFGGISVDGMMLVTRDSDNAAVYGRAVSVEEVIRGNSVIPPVAASELYTLLNALLAESVKVSKSRAVREKKPSATGIELSSAGEEESERDRERSARHRSRESSSSSSEKHRRRREKRNSGGSEADDTADTESRQGALDTEARQGATNVHRGPSHVDEWHRAPAAADPDYVPLDADEMRAARDELAKAKVASI